MKTARKYFPLFIVFFLVFLIIASCSPTGPKDTTGDMTDNKAIESVPTIVLSTTEVVKGKNRLIFGIFESPQSQIQNANVTVTFRTISPVGKLGQEAPTLTGVPFRYIGENYDGKGLYLGTVDLEEAGVWQAEVLLKNDRYDLSRKVELTVLEKSATPAIGSLAPASENKVPASYESDEFFCTAIPPCSMHHASIRETIEKKEPMLVFFASPGRCVSELCGPQLEIVERVKKEFSSKATFIHVEIFLDPESNDVNPVAYEWNLPTEPWIFLVDHEGKIFDKFEGPALEEEVKSSLTKLLSKG